MKLIKELNDSLNPIDPVLEAIKSLDSDWATQLDDDQVEMLADYMHEMIRDRQKRGNEMAAGDAAFMALEDVAGFETASQKVIQKTVERLIASYSKKFGS